MSHLLASALCLAGFAALAFATRRQQRDIFGRPLRPATTYILRFVGACALAFALGILVARQGWSLGLVMFSGHTTITAGLLLCALIGHARLHQRVVRQR
jgi:fatty acid desaturase